MEGPIHLGTTLANELGFTPDKFYGYLWLRNDNEITVSLIISNQPGKGHVRELLDTLKSRYNKIFVPVPSARMRMICEKSGFKAGVLPDDGDGLGDCEAMIYESDKKE